jgi:phospholipid-translocating ATPase
MNNPRSVYSNESAHGPTVEPLSAEENMLRTNADLVAGSAIDFVVYTGPETRAAMNKGDSQTKVGLLNLEVSHLVKVRCSRPSFETAHAEGK